MFTASVLKKKKVIYDNLDTIQFAKKDRAIGNSFGEEHGRGIKIAFILSRILAPRAIIVDGDRQAFVIRSFH